MTVLAPVELDAPLSSAMRDGSRAEHTAAEGSAFMEELLAGRVNEAGYAAYLQRLRTVYAAIESTGRSLAGTPAADAVLDPALERLAAIDADLAHWAPHVSGPVESPAASAYAERVAATTAWAPLFVAHHYTRYLGDLSGGQAIGRILARAFDLTDGAGTAFYAFDAIPKPKPYKDAYRARLDALDLDAADKERVVAEVKVAFNLNQALFSELSADLAAYRR
ncbi:biliverdin-producing heme oxygenase [Nocardioides zeae]|uniref:Biliverdin-producing heme oxygenase n=1 Tax=Nocardioides imazamoxiresistens TaxID=3231893 RepID=A0ABU3PVG5_9ACTN|nr:biliverdin-producing heme oxygenase [Nocardioides zeae]MDT9592740.1 biliverdin-producing heme oxygenase [Nocardioides zeae]